MLGSVLRDIFRGARREPLCDQRVRCVLNVGGYSKAVAIPAHYASWKQVLLDVDPRSGADLICDARNLHSRPPEQFDAIYCSHNLEHYFPHDVPKVLSGFHRVLKQDGFAEIRVPDIQALMEHLVRHNVALDDTLYQSPLGPVTALDVIYGFAKEIQESGNDFWAHKTGFSPLRLERAVKDAGFPYVVATALPQYVEIRALGFKTEPSAAQLAILQSAAR